MDVYCCVKNWTIKLNKVRQMIFYTKCLPISKQMIIFTTSKNTNKVKPKNKNYGKEKF